MLLHLFVLAALLYGPLWRKPWLTVYRQTNSVCLPVCVCLSVRLTTLLSLDFCSITIVINDAKQM